MKTFLPISGDSERKLRLYHDVLLKWQAKINLISPSTIKDAWSRHFEDSMQILQFVPSSTKTLYDIGSGAGFPGMVSAILCPNIKVTLIESDSKKCAFLQSISRETETPVIILNERIEVATQKLLAPDIITARALANLECLLELCYPWFGKSQKTQSVFLKGAQYQTEIEASKAAGWAFHVEQAVSKTDPNGQILRLSDVQKKTH